MRGAFRRIGVICKIRYCRIQRRICWNDAERAKITRTCEGLHQFLQTGIGAAKQADIDADRSAEKLFNPCIVIDNVYLCLDAYRIQIILDRCRDRAVRRHNIELDNLPRVV